MLTDEKFIEMVHTSKCILTVQNSIGNSEKYELTCTGADPGFQYGKERIHNKL